MILYNDTGVLKLYLFALVFHELYNLEWFFHVI